MANTTFKYMGHSVVVEDAAQAKRIEDVVGDGACYSVSALAKAAPGLMRALEQELKTFTDARLPADSLKGFTVANGRNGVTVMAEVDPDKRGVRGGITVGGL
jgi:hypothetical protein